MFVCSRLEVEDFSVGQIKMSVFVEMAKKHTVIDSISLSLIPSIVANAFLT